MTAPADALDTDRALKSKHRAMWAMGDYPTLAAELIPELGRTLVEACGIRQGQRVLDVAAGCGNAAIPAAQTGAQVVACDLAPELLDAGRAQASQLGVELTWRQGDAEAMPFADGEFDTVLSCVGVMFAPHHEASAGELLRVCRPGGTIGLLSWTPEGFVGQMFAAMKPYVPPPPPGAQPPPLWGSEAYVLDLLGDGITDVSTQRRTVRIDAFATPKAFRDYFKRRYGPTIAVYAGLADDPDRIAALDHDLDELARRHNLGSGMTIMDWEYLLLTARRR